MYVVISIGENHRGGGKLCSRGGNPRVPPLCIKPWYFLAIFSLERYLELVLQVASWEELLASILMQREDELEFIHYAGEDIVRILEVLQSTYLKDMALIKVTVYNLLINYS